MITDDVINLLKKRHGDIYLIEVAPESEGSETLQFVFRKPDRSTLSAAAKFSSDPIKAAEIILQNTLVHGDTKILLDDISVFQAVSAQFEEITKARTATIKKL